MATKIENSVYLGELPWVLHGKYTDANVFIRTYDQGVINQTYDLINSRAFKGRKVSLMPDAHVGASGPCGLVAEIGDYINPEHVGMDVGCSVSLMLLNKPIPTEKLVEFEHKIKSTIPFGFEVHEKTMVNEKDFYKFIMDGFNKYRNYWPEMLGDLPTYVDEKWINQVLKRVNLEPAKFWHSLGTVGGGNHFIEYDINEEKNIAAVTLHFGSRKFGLNIWRYWTNLMKAPAAKRIEELKNAIKIASKNYKDSYKKSHKNMKNFSEDLKKFQQDYEAKYLDQTGHLQGYLTGEDMKGYLQDMCLAQLYAQYNHITVQDLIKKIIQVYGIEVTKTILTVHNFVDLHDHCLRKSSIRSYEGEEIVIPFNMRDGIAVCKGKSNGDWLNSAPHGAGRTMTRRAARELLRSGDVTMDDFRESMKGIVSTSIVAEVIDEAPFVYKDWKEIAEVIQGTCDIEFLMKPLINLKACDGDVEG